MGGYVLSAWQLRVYEEREGNTEHHNVGCDVEYGVDN